jgi:hypothetical protein
LTEQNNGTFNTFVPRVATIRLQERASAIIERRPDLERFFEDEKRRPVRRLIAKICRTTPTHGFAACENVPRA